MNWYKSKKRFLLLFAVGIFVLSATDTFYFYHLFAHHNADGSSHHDSDNCSICRNHFYFNSKCSLPPDAPSIIINDFIVAFHYKSNTSISAVYRASLFARPPPIA